MGSNGRGVDFGADISNEAKNMAKSSKPLTAPQRRLVDEIRAGKYYLYGSADVRVARSLEAAGIVTLTDNGSLGGRRVDGERWSVELTEAGKATDTPASSAG